MDDSGWSGSMRMDMDGRLSGGGGREDVVFFFTLTRHSLHTQMGDEERGGLEGEIENGREK